MASEIEQAIENNKTSSSQLAMLDRSDDSLLSIKDSQLDQLKIGKSHSAALLESINNNTEALELIPYDINQHFKKASAIEPEVLDPLEDSSEVVIRKLNSMDRSLQTLVDYAFDSSIKLGTTDDTGKPKDNKLSSSFDGMGMGMGMGMGGIGKGFGKVMSVGAKVLGVAGLAVGAATMLHSLFEGFTNDDVIQNIAGKAKEELTGAEQSAVALAHMVETMSMGFFDAKSVFENAVGIVQLMQDGIDSLFDPDVGVFGELTKSIFKVVEEFDSDEILSSIASSVWEIVKGAVSTLPDIGNALLNILPSDIGDGIKKFLSDTLFDPETGIFWPITKGVGIALEKFNEGDILGGIASLATGIFDTIVEIPSRIFNILKDWASSLLDFLPGQIKDGIGKVASNIFDTGKGVLGFAGNLLGLGGDEDKTMVASSEPSTFGKGFSNLTDNLLGFGKKEEPEIVSSPINVPNVPNVLRAAQVEQSPMRMQPIPTTSGQGRRVNQLSRKRMNDGQRRGISLQDAMSDEQVRPITVQSAQPSVVVNQAPSPKTAIIRETTNPDLRLALMNSGMMDG